MRRMVMPLARGLALCLLVATAARGEPFLDLYGGVAVTDSAKVTASHEDCFALLLFFRGCTDEVKATRTVAFDRSTTFGVRGGYWSETRPWLGIAGDLSFFEAESKTAHFQIVPVSVLLMLRVPLLVSEELPKGRLQPYGALGPMFVFRHSAADFRPDLQKKVAVTSGALGAEARVGLTWLLNRRVGVFAEYRLTHVSMPDGSDKSGERIDTELNTNHLLGGVSLRF